MRSFLIGVMLLFVMLTAVPASALAGAGAVPQWTPGSVDLQDWDFTKRGGVKLDGEWEFYWGKLYSPSDFREKTLRKELDYIRMPAQWGGLPWRGEALSNHGFGTYRLRVKLPEQAAGRTMAIQMRSVATAYEIWVNGEPLGGRGTVGESREEITARNAPQLVYFNAKDGSNEVVIQVSNFVQRKGGIWEGISLGDAGTMAKERDVRAFVDVFVFGCLFVMGLYHIVLYFLRKNDKAPLYFGIMCLAVAMRTAVLGETLGPVMLPSVSWEAWVKIEYGSASIGLLMLVYFVNTQYPSAFRRAVDGLFTAMHAAFIVLVLFASADLYTRFMLPFQLLVAVPTVLYSLLVYAWASVKRLEGSAINMIGCLTLACAIVNDILYFNQAVSTGSFIPFGLLFFMFTQSVNVAFKFSKAFYTAESLSGQLKEANSFLERKVSERTAELTETNERLEEANRELSQSEQYRLQLLANISHELNTPLTSVQGFARAMADGLIEDDYPKYAQRIYERTLLLERVIDDLIELTKLETRQLLFHFEERSALPLFRLMFDKYDTKWFEDGSFRMHWDDSAASAPEGREIAVLADSYRLEQVFSNLLSNARKYSKGGDISVILELLRTESEGHALRVTVMDSGPGIPDEEIPFIFNRFYRGRQAGAAGPKGSGLGLTICKEIMNYHNGEIGFTREVETGSAFYFQLPARLRPIDK